MFVVEPYCPAGQYGDPAADDLLQLDGIKIPFAESSDPRPSECTTYTSLFAGCNTFARTKHVCTRSQDPQMVVVIAVATKQARPPATPMRHARLR